MKDVQQFLTALTDFRTSGKPLTKTEYAVTSATIELRVFDMETKRTIISTFRAAAISVSTLYENGNNSVSFKWREGAFVFTVEKDMVTLGEKEVIIGGASDHSFIKIRFR